MEYSLGHPHGHGDVTEPEKPKTAQGIIAKSQRDCEAAKAKEPYAPQKPSVAGVIGSLSATTQTLSEAHRTYVWANGDEYKLGEPRVLYAQRDGDGVIHVIKDNTGLYHHIPAGWLVFKSLPHLR